MSGDERSVAGLVDDYLERRIDRRAFFRRSAAIGLSASGAAAILAACGGGKSGGSAATTAATSAAAPATSAGASSTTAAAAIKKGGQLIEGYDRDFSKVDPVLTTWDDPTFVAVYEFPVIRDDKGQYAPSLFSAWDVSSDLLTWTFTLRPDLVFQSGAPCDAAAVAANFNAFRDPKAGQNAIFWPSVKDVAAKDATTVVVTMKVPFTAFPETLATENSMPCDLAKRTALKDAYGTTEAAGTGPFQLASYQPGTAVVANRWDKYPGSGIPFVENTGVAHLDSVKWVPIVQVGSRANEIETGSVHVVKNPAPQDVDRLMANGDLVTTQFPALANWWLSPDCSRTDLGFDDVRVRQAMSHAIDREGLAKSLYFGHAAATYGPLASNVTWYDKGVEQFNQYDPEKAKSLLDAAGWTAGSDGIRAKGGKKLSFEHLCDSGQPTTSPGIDQAIVPMLKEVGIDMRVKVVDDASFNKSVFGGGNGPASWSYEWLWSSPVDLLVYFHVVPTDATNGAIPEVKAACDAWQKAGSRDELAAAASQLQLAWAENLPKIPVLTTYNVWVASKKVMGYTPLQTMLYPLYNDVWLDA